MAFFKNTRMFYIVLFSSFFVAGQSFAQISLKEPYVEFSAGGSTLLAQSSTGILTTFPTGDPAVYSDLYGRMEQENMFGPVLNFAFGASFSSVIRSALSVSYFQADQMVRSMATELGDPSTGHNSTTSYLNAQTWLFMANFYADFGSYLPLVPSLVKPYVGVGIGVAHNKLGKQFTYADGNGVSGVSLSNSRNDFAYRLMCGINFAITTDCLFQVQYAFIDAGRYASGTSGYANASTATFIAIPYMFHSYANQFTLGLVYHIT